MPGAYTEMSRKPLSTSSVCLVEYIMLLAGGLGVQQDASIHAWENDKGDNFKASNILLSDNDKQTYASHNKSILTLVWR